MTSISISYDIRGTAPRTLFDILNTEEDSEGGAISFHDLFDAEYDQYIQPRNAAATKPIFLS